MKKLSISLAQLNLTVGDIAANQQQIAQQLQQAAATHVDLIVFPELAICGYPCEDLLFTQGFVQDCQQAIQDLSSQHPAVTSIIGYPTQQAGRYYNAAAVINADGIIAQHHKQALPNYGVFDEQRYFKPGDQATLFSVNGYKIGILICEDLWQDEPIAQACAQGAEIIISINGSPFDKQQQAARQHLLARQAKQHQITLVYVNHVGGQDELVFDGNSCVFDSQGQCVSRLPSFETAVHTVEISRGQSSLLTKGSVVEQPTWMQACYRALCLATRDYVIKNGFQRAIIGLSGGIDSAVTLSIAVAALGAENVTAVMMPSRFTQKISLLDAERLATNLNVDYQVIDIEPSLQALAQTLQLQQFDSLTGQNLQARCRGLLLMALSNQHNSLVLSTSNKSEIAVGYTTLYGDMVGAFNVLKDLYKTEVYQLAHTINQSEAIMPQRIIDRSPSAELAHEQTDQDSLPDYAVLDAMLEQIIEHNASRSMLQAQGFPLDQIENTLRRIHQNEYKRFQGPPGPKLTQRAFGRDWRQPLTSKYRY